MKHYPEDNLLQKNLKIIQQHLDRNGNWLQWPEHIVHSFEKNRCQADATFFNELIEIEKILKDLEKMLEN